MTKEALSFHRRNETILGVKEEKNTEGYDIKPLKLEPPETPSSSSNHRASPPRNIPEKVNLTKPTHPFLKLPKQNVASTSSSQEREPETPSPYVFTAPSDPFTPFTGTPTPAAKVKLEQPRPSFEFRSQQTPKVPLTPSKGSTNTAASELFLATKRLAPAIAAMNKVVSDVKSALGETPESEAKEKMMALVRHMKLAFFDVQVDAEGLEETAEAQAKG